jgi:hypothetical protein
MDDYIDHEMLQIPAHIAASILPASAKSLSTTVLPAIDKSLRCEFSNNPPTSMNMEVFSRQDIPSGETIGRMEAGFGAALAKGCQSIFVRARNAWHPLWVLSFWRQVQHIALPEQKDWQRSLCWIDRLEASGDKDTIQSLLLTFPWAGDLLEVGGFQSDRVSMTRMLSDRWSNDYSQNLLLGLIQDQLGTDISSHVVLINAELLRSLEILAATNVSTGALDGFLNVLGTRDVAGFHCREKHWRAFCTSRATQQVAFGDSLQETEMRRYKAIHINTDFRELWEWFFLQYPVAGVVSVKPVGIRMRTSPQELAIDWFSCGFLSANALREYLAHRFTHTEMLILVGETKEARDRFRLKSAIAVLQVETFHLFCVDY